METKNSETTENTIETITNTTTEITTDTFTDTIINNSTITETILKTIFSNITEETATLGTSTTESRNADITSFLVYHFYIYNHFPDYTS